MKKNRLLILACLSLLSLLPTKVKATHCAGAEILYEWVSDSTYRIYYKFYRDCIGAAEPITVPLLYTNPCDNITRTVTLTKLATLPDGTPNGDEVSPGCPGFPTTCTQTSSALPGYREWWYTGTVTLPFRCNNWTFSYTLSARNNSITNLQDPGAQNIYVEATLDNLDAQGNTSPSFSVKPVPYICDNIPYTYNNGAFDRNNDSMVFTLLQPRTGPTSPIPFAAPVGSDPPFNITNNPLACNNTFTLDPQNGQLSFTPNEIQRAVVTVLVTEYRNGKAIGSVMRDIQVVVLACNIQQPQVKIVKPTVTGATYNDTTVVGCATVPLSFCFNASSASASAVLVVHDNSGAVLLGSSMSYTNQKTNLVTGCLSWTPGPTDTGLKIFTVTVTDSSCAPPGIIVSNTFSLPIYIWPETVIYSDTGICPGGAAHLVAVGGGNFVWNVLPGGSPLSSLSCINCSSPIATPTVTTRYTVESQINTICKNRDTVTVTVAYPPTFNAGVDTTTCINDSVQLNIDVISAPGDGLYDIKWTPSTGLSSDIVPDPIASPTTTTQYVVTLSPDGVTACATRDTINVRVLQGFTIDNQDTAICLGDAVQVRGRGDGGYNYNWTPTSGVSNSHELTPLITPDSSATYVITASYPGCSDSTMRFAIDVQPVPTVVTDNDLIICAGDTSHLFTIVTPPYDKYTYTWTPGSGLDDPSKPNPIFSGLISGQLKVVVNTPAGCKGSDSFNVRIVKVDFLHISHDTVVCPHDSVQIHITGDSLASFYWSPDWRINDTMSADPYVSPERTQYYTVYAIDSNNCKDTAWVLVTVKPAAVLNIPDSVLIYPGDTYQISPETNCMYFSWFPFLGLTSPTISNPVASPEVNTRYFVTASTESGCSTRDSINILVSPDSQIDMPNAFAPGNGPNNILKVLHLGSATLKRFTIYNRWGVKVFETTDLSEGWDGTLNGSPQPLGVYVYLVEAVTYRGRVVSKQGNVTLLR